MTDQPPFQRLRELVDSWRKSAQTHDNYAHFRDEPYDDVAHEHRVKALRLRKCADELEAALAAQEASPQGWRGGTDSVAERGGAVDLHPELRMPRPVEEASPHLSVDEIRGGEDNSGPLESTDLFLEGRGISLLLNVTVAGEVTYSAHLDGQAQSGTLRHVEASPQPEIARAFKDGWQMANDSLHDGEQTDTAANAWDAYLATRRQE